MTRPSSMCLAVGQGSAFRSDFLSGLRLDPAWSSLVRDQVHLLSISNARATGHTRSTFSLSARAMGHYP